MTSKRSNSLVYTTWLRRYIPLVAIGLISDGGGTWNRVSPVFVILFSQPVGVAVAKALLPPSPTLQLHPMYNTKLYIIFTPCWLLFMDVAVVQPTNHIRGGEGGGDWNGKRSPEVEERTTMATTGTYKWV